MEQFIYYLLGLIVIIIGFLIVKKVATCMLKFIIGIVILGILAGIYILAT